MLRIAGKVIHSLFVFCILMSLGGCSWKRQETSDRAQKMRVQIPFTMDGKVQLQVIELITIEDLSSLKGGAAQFFMEPEVGAYSGPDSSLLTGRPPQIHYMRNADGVIVPTDDLSLQLLTTYAHYEKLKILDSSLGVGSLLAWPAKVAMNVKFKAGDAVVENNALYSSKYDALLVVPYTEKQLPLLVNAGVLGHEHFHAIFQKQVISVLNDKYPSLRSQLHRASIHDESTFLKWMNLLDDQFELGFSLDPAVDEATKNRLRYSAVLLRGVNEGFADVWGWVYSGDSNFVGRSIVQEKIGRSLDFPLSSLTSSEDVYNHVLVTESLDPMTGVSYLLGNEIARAIKNFALMYAKQRKLSLADARLQVGRWLLASLAQLGQQYSQKYDAKQKLSPADVLNILAQNVSDLSATECSYFVKLTPAVDRTTEMTERCRKLAAGGQ